MRLALLCEAKPPTSYSSFRTRTQISRYRVGVDRVGVPLAESSYFATFADSSCCVALSASVLALSAKKIQKVTIKFALFQQVQLF